MSVLTLSELLEMFADPYQAKKTQKHNKCLRGIRGVAPGEVARIATAYWVESGLQLSRDEDDLRQLFGTAFEDGLLAITLLAPLATTEPDACLDIALDWAMMLDDAQSTDALGWGIFGPILLVSPDGYDAIQTLQKQSNPWARRAAVMAALAALPLPIEGTVAACIRANLGQKTVRFVDTPMHEWVQRILDASVRDSHPAVQKAVRRVTGAWALHAPEEALHWGQNFRGGLPKMIRIELEKNAKKGRKILKNGPN